MIQKAFFAADPRLTDYELLLQNIADLKNGKDVQARWVTLVAERFLNI